VADNVEANAGAGGAVFASDDIGGVQYPRTKPSWGADGSATDVADTNAAALPVRSRVPDTLASAQVAVDTTLGGTQIVAARAGRQATTIVNLGTTDVYLGVSGVTTGTGLLLLGVKGAAITIPGAAAIFGIVGAGSQTVSYLEAYFA